MTKISISILAFVICGAVSVSVFAGNDAADADSIFRAATALQKTMDTASDAELVAALKELKKLVDDGNRHLLNQKVKKATAVAERVSAQMELVQLLAKVAELKVRLHALQEDAESLAKENTLLQRKYERLMLAQKGRALTGAHPTESDALTGAHPTESDALGDNP